MDFRMVAALACSGLFLLTNDFSWAQDPEVNYNPEKIVGASECGNCHAVELSAWEKTHHFRTYKDLPSSTDAEEIADKMDIFDITEESDCLQCHFTLKKNPGEDLAEAISGISCELCHGAAKDWLDVHNQLGEWEDNKAAEPAEHKEARLAAAAEKGMNRLDSLYDFVSSCYACHTVPHEYLVNTGGHKAGSDFEIVAWSQGEVRHNFLKSEAKNAPRTKEHLRVMYVTGRILDLEYGLRGLAEATKKEAFAVAMAKRIKNAQQKLNAIVEAGANIKPVTDVLGVVADRSSLSGKAGRLQAAEKIRAIAKSFIAEQDAHKTELTKIDGLLPASSDYQGPVFRE